MHDILSTIRMQYEHFTRAEKRVADYVLSNPQKVVYLSINDLAEMCGVGETSVFRFCRDLNQKGYQDFKMHVAQAIAASSEEDAAKQLTGAVSFRDTLPEVCQKVLSSSITALQETYQAVRCEELSEAVQWMIDAVAIHFFGVGGSMVTALEAKSRFIRITPKVHMSEDLHLQMMEAALMTERDVAVLFSYSGATKDTLDIARRAKEAGARLIAITRYQKSSLSKLCDVALICGANEGPLQGGSMAVKMSQFFLLDVLYLEYFKQTYEASTMRRAQTAAAISEKLQ
ncbi:MurR/RpiR family transcriptional regulator [Eubacteriales bacterium OttesenSCG-928-A19]|nr:MurR/RpiR family transcriptional regulator [Eubacteriales bacterium OttesenSCG-928-A19]